MKLSDFIMVRDGAVEDNICDKLIMLYNSNSHTESGVANGCIEKQTRNATEFNVSENPNYKQIHQYMTQLTYNSYIDYLEYLPEWYAKHLPSQTNELSVEAFRIKHYLKDEGFYHEHVDNVGDRMFAFIYYLNTVDVGGETSFCNNITDDVKPVKGRLLIFPTSWQYPHEALIPKSGDKMIVQGYLNDVRNYK